MKLFRIISALEGEVTEASGVSHFDGGRRRQVALAGYESAGAMLAFLGRDDSDAYKQKEATVRAILAEHRAGLNGYWTSLLLAAFGPMLCRLRGRIFPDDFDGDDLDQMVIFAFLTAAGGERIDNGRGRLCLRLRQATERRVFSWLRGEKRAREMVEFIEPGALCENESASWPVPGMIKRQRLRNLKHDPEETRQLGQLLRARVGSAVERDNLDLVIATAIGQETVREYTDRHHPGLPPMARERAYQRIKRRRNRTIARLREVLLNEAQGQRGTDQ